MKTIKLQDDQRYKAYLSIAKDKGFSLEECHKYARQSVFYDRQEDIFMAKFKDKLNGKTAE